MEYNISYTYDQDLKSVAENPTEMALQIQKLLSEASLTTNPLRAAKLKGSAGALLNTLRKGEQAEKQLSEALSLLEKSPAFGVAGDSNIVSPTEVLKITLKLRLYDVYRYQNKNDIAEKGFKEILGMTEIGSSSQNYRDFALQHLGKLYFNMNQYDKALECFEEALALRVVKEDDDLIKSTEIAMQATLYAKHQGDLQT